MDSLEDRILRLELAVSTLQAQLAQQPSPKSGYVVPDCFKAVDGFTEALGGWIESRRKRGRPATGRAIQLLINRLAEQPQRAVAALDMATERGWLTLKWSWLDREEEDEGHGYERPTVEAWQG